MTTRLHATIMLWSASTDPIRQCIEARVNSDYAAWRADPNGIFWGKRIDGLRDSLNDLANYRHDEALIYEEDKVVGIRPEYLPDFREWCVQYEMDSGGL